MAFNPTFMMRVICLCMSLILATVDAAAFPKLNVGKRGIVPTRGFSVGTVHNSRFKADGPKQFMRSARKWGVQLQPQFTDTLSNKGLSTYLQR